MKYALIKQPIGIGDVFYLQKFAFILKKNGYDVVWPLRDDIFWIKDYVKGFNFCRLIIIFRERKINYVVRF